MKNIITYITILAAFAAVSCTRTDETIESLDAPVLTISLNAGEMMTKSAIPNVEDVVTQFDWFFYEDNTGSSTPVHHGHYSVSGTTVTYVAGDVASAATADSDEIHLGFNLEDPSYADIKGSYYVYVLANYDGIDHSSVTNLTLEELLAKTMDTNFDEESDDYTKINNFVMDSYSGDDEADFPQLISVKKATDPDKDGKANLPVDLRRVAAKITFTLNISSSLVDANGSTWKPITGSSNFTTYMVNTVNHATVAGEPVNADTNAETGYSQSTGMGAYQTSYATTHVKTATDGDTGLEWEVDPFYSYPVSYELDSNNAPYLKISLPWENVDATTGELIGMGATLYYYKVYLRDNSGNAITTLERNKHYIATVNVDKLGGTQEDYVELDTFYYVADWQSPSNMYDGYYAPRFLDIPEDVYFIYGDSTITIALTSSHPISAEIVGTPSQIDINDRERIRSITDAGDGEYTLAIRQVWFTDANNPQQRQENGTNTATLTTEGRVSFTLNYKMNTTIASHLMDLTPITWDILVYHTDESSVSDNVTIIQYPSIYLELNHTDADASTFLDAYAFPNPDQQTVIRARSGNNGTQRQGNYLGALGGGSPTSRDKTVFTVSTLASMIGGNFDGMLIGDPRVPFSTLTEAQRTHQGRTWGANDLGQYDDGDFSKYLVASPDKTNFIAPRFMFASGHLGSNANNSNFNQGGNWRTAAERCAAYQEDGYPAGRWRLPTEAEVSFCRQIQANGYISGLYYPSNPYWTASGTIYQSGSVHTPGDSETASVRCVYDLWYWGEESYDASGKKIPNDSDGNPTGGTPATVWLGYMTE